MAVLLGAAECSPILGFFFFQLSGIVIADIDEGTVTPHPNAEIPRLPSFAVSLYKFRYFDFAFIAPHTTHTALQLKPPHSPLLPFRRNISFPADSYPLINAGNSISL